MNRDRIVKVLDASLLACAGVIAGTIIILIVQIVLSVQESAS